MSEWAEDIIANIPVEGLELTRFLLCYFVLIMREVQILQAVSNRTNRLRPGDNTFSVLWMCSPIKKLVKSSVGSITEHAIFYLAFQAVPMYRGQLPQPVLLFAVRYA